MLTSAQLSEYTKSFSRQYIQALKELNPQIADASKLEADLQRLVMINFMEYVLFFQKNQNVFENQSHNLCSFKEYLFNESPRWMGFFDESMNHFSNQQQVIEKAILNFPFEEFERTAQEAIQSFESEERFIAVIESMSYSYYNFCSVFYSPFFNMMVQLFQAKNPRISVDYYEKMTEAERAYYMGMRFSILYQKTLSGEISRKEKALETNMPYQPSLILCSTQYVMLLRYFYVALAIKEGFHQKKIAREPLGSKIKRQKNVYLVHNIDPKYQYLETTVDAVLDQMIEIKDAKISMRKNATTMELLKYLESLDIDGTHYYQKYQQHIREMISDSKWTCMRHHLSAHELFQGPLSLLITLPPYHEIIQSLSQYYEEKPVLLTPNANDSNGSFQNILSSLGNHNNCQHQEQNAPISTISTQQKKQKEARKFLTRLREGVISGIKMIVKALSPIARFFGQLLMSIQTWWINQLNQSSRVHQTPRAPDANQVVNSLNNQSASLSSQNHIGNNTISRKRFSVR